MIEPIRDEQETIEFADLSEAYQCIWAAALCEEQIKDTGELEGTIECPACDNELHYSSSPTHHNYFLKCRTDGCLNFHADGAKRETPPGT
jgi:hypothetical protein